WAGLVARFDALDLSTAGLTASRDLVSSITVRPALVVFIFTRKIFFFKQKTAYEIGLGIPAEPLFRSVNHTSRGSISTSTLPSIKLRKCSSKIITSILSFISGRLATKSNQIKQLIRNGRSASLQRTFKKSFTSFSHSTRNKTR